MEEFASFRENRRGLDDQEYLMYALSLRYREYKPWEPLCRIGDAPNEIYYVLSGKVAVTSVNALNYTEEALEGKIFHNEYPGATLGEASILYNSNRTATLIAAGVTSILYLLKEPYMRTIGDLVRKAHLYRIEMIQKQDIFSEWTMAQLASLYRNFEKKELSYGFQIYKPGDINDMIYVILKGEVEVN
jgi:CRP-like cAMP-binding protein